MKVGRRLLPYISPDTPVDTRVKAARGEGLGELGADERLTVLFVLTRDRDAAVAAEAKKTFDGLDEPFLIDALDGARLDPLVLKAVIEAHSTSEAAVTLAALHPNIDAAALATVAEKGPEGVVAALLDDAERLAAEPALLDALSKNPLVSSVAIEGARERAAALSRSGAGFVEAKAARAAVEEAAKGALRGDKEGAPDDDAKRNVFKMVQGMTVGQKIKFAMTGNKAARDFLTRDSNKVVVSAVLKNPRITEEEIVRMVSSKSTSDDALREISQRKDWVKNYGVKLAMVTNPKTPLTVSLKLIDSIYEKDLVGLSKSRNVPSVLTSAARRRLESRKK